MKNFKSINFNHVLDVMGKSSELYIIINSYDDYDSKTDLKTAIVYRFTKTELKKDMDLTALIFGRSNSFGVFKGSAVTAKTLNHRYINNAIDVIMIDDLQQYATTNNHSNLGIAVEYYLIDKFNGKHGTQKQDKELKQDCLINGHYVQIKCSLATENTKGSFSTTNN